jgi:dUTP pyrophosphatase
VSISSVPQAGIKVIFFRNAEAVYGQEGLAPATAASAGTDLRACPEDGGAVVIGPGERRSIGSGIAIEPLMPGIAGFVYSRSGLGAVKGLTVAQGVGLIDPDYRGEIRVILLNTSAERYTVRPGERIAQLVFQPFVRPLFQVVEALEETERGAGGFGHTGK